MQLRKTMMMLTALSALSVVMAGCGTDNTSSTTCTADTDCLEGEICHPTAKICVQTCTLGADCPRSAPKCAAISSTDNRMVCQCSTDQLCNSDGATDQVCSSLDKICEPKCTADTDCGSGRTCDTATGQCNAGNTGTDCTYGSCGAGEVCNSTTNKCETAATCTGEAQSTCSYGQFCSSTGKCADVGQPTCTNLEGKPAASFTPATGTGYVIYNVEKAEFGGTTDCGAGTQRVIPRVYFYTKDGTLPTSQAQLQGGFYVKTTKEEIALNAGNMFAYTRSADGKSASVKVFLCADEALNQISLGFYFTGGNGYCATLTK